MRALLALAALGALAAALAFSAITRTPNAGPGLTPTGTSTPGAQAKAAARTPAPPQPSVAQINGQDRTSRAHRAREARLFDRRALLTVLPVARAGVRIDLAGLSRDGTRTVLSVDVGARTRAHAREVLDRVLGEHDDSGSGYRIAWTR